MSKKMFIKTYGCQMNVYDSDKIQDLLTAQDYINTNDIKEADLIILNTCYIREKAAEKIYSELGRIKSIRKKESIVIIAGCVAQAEKETIFKRAPIVDIVVGPQFYHLIPKLIINILNGDKNLIKSGFINENKFNYFLNPSSIKTVSNFIPIQEGCNKFCTYCVVPYTRGAEYSRPIEQIYQEITQIVKLGSKEIVLLGQNVNAYHGKDINGETYDLSKLISYIAKIDQVKRIRYTTSHPKDMSDALIHLHKEEPKLMPFLHLPVQSGSNKILKFMNRKYTREQYFAIIEKLKNTCPNIAFSSDFIVGFPDETEKDFEDTLNLVKEIKFAQHFSFKYSPRPNTPAALMQQIPDEIKTERLHRLQAELMSQQLQFNKSCIGKTFPVLLEYSSKDSNQIVGKTPYSQLVRISDNSQNYGQIATVLITQAFPNSLIGCLSN